MIGRLQSWLALTRSRFARWGAFGESRNERVYRVALLLALLLGVALRVNLYAIERPTLWEDEAYWAWKTLTLPVLTQTFRPPGFLLLTKGLVTSLGPTELTFRALPFLSGMAGLLASPYAARRLFSSNVTRFVVVLLLALHPAALTMSVEFKQYGVELGVFVLLLAAFLGYREQPSTKRLLLLLALAWSGFFFSIIIIFLYPALFGVLLWDAFKSRRFRVVAMASAAALLCVATIVTIYFTTWRKFDENKAEAKWGDKYDVFYVANEKESRFAWTANKYADVAALPGLGRVHWHTEQVSEPVLLRLVDIDRSFWIAMHAIGIAWLLWRRRWHELAWLWSPLLVMFLFNVLGRWPAGAFRTNAGVVPFSIFLAAYGLEAASTLKPSAGRALVAFATLLMLGPTLLMRPGWLSKGTFARPGRFDEVLEHLAQNIPAGGKGLVLMENSSCRPWRYYSEHDARIAQTIGPKLRRHFRGQCAGGGVAKAVARSAAARKDFWVVLTDRRRDKAVDAATKRGCRKVERTAVGDGLHVVWHCLPKTLGE